MKLLILGGTRFLGRHLVETALEAGHDITLFNRGESAPDLYPDLPQVHGDRDGGLSKLGDTTWDAVIDPSGYVPRLVGDAARFFAERTRHYTFISSISVYPEHTARLDESAPVQVLEDPTTEEVTPEAYGGLKALCEEAAEAAMPGRVLHVRAGMIVGPYDTTDRFTFWVRRVACGGRFPIPGPPDRPIQLIHGGDIARWVLSMAERGEGGVFNTTGPDTPHTMGTVIGTIREASGSSAEPVWLPDQPFLDQGLNYWSDLPFVIDAESMGVMDVDVSRAIAAGLTLRPLLQTVRETLAWDMGRPVGTQLKAGMSPEKERAVLEGSA